MTPRTRPVGTGRLRAAGVLQLIQGGLMEGLPFLGLLVILAFGVDAAAITAHAQVFALPYLKDDLALMMVMSGIFGALRIVGAIGLLRDRMWGLALSVINCTVTLALMVFLLPAGILDGLLSGTALILILTAWFGSARITRPDAGTQTAD
ncbi:hypothetical protein ABCS02_25045 [Microbacterium sp. X-17]|uniref:hypothetical protein n=1 Tax=Microbacterium sp. X-17 TaxID=3144404 RepID=UPI0031F52CF0